MNKDCRILPGADLSEYKHLPNATGISAGLSNGWSHQTWFCECVEGNVMDYDCFRECDYCKFKGQFIEAGCPKCQGKLIVLDKKKLGMCRPCHSDRNPPQWIVDKGHKWPTEDLTLQRKQAWITEKELMLKKWLKEDEKI